VPMRTILSLVIVFLITFCVMVWVAVNCEPRMPGAQSMSMAFEWTLRLIGGVVASAAAVGMLLGAARHGSFQRQIVLTPPLLAGLLLMNAHWALAVALGAVVGIWMFRFGAPDVERANSKD